jgi:hypothetical protein
MSMSWNSEQEKEMMQLARTIQSLKNKTVNFKFQKWGYEDVLITPQFGQYYLGAKHLHGQT